MRRTLRNQTGTSLVEAVISISIMTIAIYSLATVTAQTSSLGMNLSHQNARNVLIQDIDAEVTYPEPCIAMLGGNSIPDPAKATNVTLRMPNSLGDIESGKPASSYALIPIAAAEMSALEPTGRSVGGQPLSTAHVAIRVSESGKTPSLRERRSKRFYVVRSPATEKIVLCYRVESLESTCSLVNGTFDSFSGTCKIIAPTSPGPTPTPAPGACNTPCGPIANGSSCYTSSQNSPTCFTNSAYYCSKNAISAMSMINGQCFIPGIGDVFAAIGGYGIAY